jgi:hypothetical protein
MDTFYDVLGFVGGSGVLLAAVAWLIRAALSHGMARDLEAFKTKLESASTTEAERLRHELHLVASDVEKRTGLLNEKRAEVIAELYKRLVDFVSAAESFASYTEWKGEPSKNEKAAQLGEKADAFVTYYQHHRIYFSEGLANSLRDLFETVHRPALAFRMWMKMAERSSAAALKHDEAWDKAWDAIQKGVPPLLTEIEKEFRALLGVTKVS